ncbi:alpha/beta hydrolase family protein [Ureibacillus sp. 179-F W5.1 NHS]|uniref:S9 family peptidase n=1 Tax=Lysinibacillus halotolerans TaxID=1368476 RepID=A0A3M8H045_9BACI|nr:prolyl oligopeptidase family serine peptidase [Lysinibacillus halotolerans]RNC95394.1 S9 family peptidase [Lysinibacillus halotolerans]
MKDNGSIESIRSYPSPNPNVVLKEIIYWSQGLRVKGLLAKPVHEDDCEALLYLRGGLQSIGMVRPSRIAQFASQGFIVFAPYYRGNRGGEGRDEMAGDDRFDAIHSVEVLKQFVEKKDVHLFGFSRGGLMALWTAILRNDIKSVVTWAGVSNVTSMYMERVDMRRTLKRIIGGSPNKEQEKYDERTPIFKVNDIHAPVLIIHGTEDENVSIHQAYELEQALIKENKQVETWYSSGLSHHYPPQLNRQTVKALCEWMKLK